MRTAIDLENDKSRYTIRLFDDSLTILISDNYVALAEIKLTDEKLELRYLSGNSLPLDPDKEIALVSDEVVVRG